MRPILTREEANALIDRIPQIKAQGFTAGPCGS